MSIPLSPERAHALMAQTLLCPIVQGDLPYQHRLFDVRRRTTPSHHAIARVLFVTSVAGAA
jgi:hypothetical protein